MTLCRFHHRLVHEGQVIVQALDDGAFRFIRPDGASFESPLPADDASALVTDHAERAIVVTPRTAVTRWTGEALDLGEAVGWLMRNDEQHRKSTSAETSVGS